MKKYVCFIVLFTIIVSTTTADALADILQDLAVQTACLGMYSTAQTGVYVTSRYDDPPDWYDPPMLANRFAAMSGNMTRINTFYGVCFDYAQFAWDDIKRYQKSYNDAGMIGQQWYIAVTNKNDPYTIILYDPVSRENATIISNGVYLKENSRHRVYAHDGATGHAWLWVQHSNGTWYWIDPTWTDNTGYPWWGKVENGREVQYYPDPKYSINPNYLKPIVANNEQPRSSNTTNTQNTKPATSNTSSGSSNNKSYFLIGYNYSFEGFHGLTIGYNGFYISFDMNMSAYADGVTSSSSKDEYLLWRTGETTEVGMEFLLGYSFNLYKNIFRLPIGIGMRLTDTYYYYKDNIGNKGWTSNDNFMENKYFIAEAGLQLILLKFLYISSTFRTIGFSDIGFSVGAGFVY